MEISFGCSGIYIYIFFISVKEKEQELEQLTKELRQVNLQQFIQQTGTKVTVLPAQPAGENNGMSHTHTCTTHTDARTYTQNSSICIKDYILTEALCIQCPFYICMHVVPSCGQSAKYIL